MARITVEDCQERVNNRFLLVTDLSSVCASTVKAMSPSSKAATKEAVTALREIAAGKVLPDDMSLYNPLPEGQESAKNEG